MFLNPWQQELDEVTQGLMTLSEAADYLSLTLEEITNLVQKGYFRQFYIKKQPFLALGQIDQYWMECQGTLMGTNPALNPTENPFKGVHPILHTLFQIRESIFDHKSFQTRYITYASDLMNEQLEGSNYFAHPDASLKVAGRTVYPDVLVKGLEAELDFSSAGLSSPDLVIDMPRIAVDVLIGQMESKTGKVIPVTAIELLSPTNLDRTSRLDEFTYKQQQFLAQGLNVVVIHLLQTLPPVLEDIPRYPEAADSAPYHITVTRPQDIGEYGQYRTQVYRFGIDTPIPTVALPLLGEDKIAFNFDAPYQKTFMAGRFNQEIDYDAISPQVLTKFRENDRQHIEQRLTEIRQHYHAQVSEGDGNSE